jgi:hypothetical protein
MPMSIVNNRPLNPMSLVDQVHREAMVAGAVVDIQHDMRRHPHRQVRQRYKRHKILRSGRRRAVTRGKIL